MSILYKSLLIFSCPRSSIPTLLCDSWFIIQSDRRGNVRPSNQMTSKFLTQASWRLYEIRQPPTSFQIRPLNSGEKYLRTDKTERTDWTDWTVRTDRKTWLTFKLELLLIWLKCATHWLVVTKVKVGNDWHILEIVVGTIWDPFYMCQFHLHTTPRMLLYISFKTNLNSVPFCFVYLAISFGHNFYISSSKALTSLKLSSSFWLFRISGCIICTQLLYWFFKSEKSLKPKLFFLALSDIWQNHLHTTSILVLQKR